MVIPEQVTYISYFTTNLLKCCGKSSSQVQYSGILAPIQLVEAPTFESPAINHAYLHWCERKMNLYIFWIGGNGAIYEVYLNTHI